MFARWRVKKVVNAKFSTAVSTLEYSMPLHGCWAHKRVCTVVNSCSCIILFTVTNMPEIVSNLNQFIVDTSIC